jgi:hypothetical protein
MPPDLDLNQILLATDCTPFFVTVIREAFVPVCLLASDYGAPRRVGIAGETNPGTQ